ncbi:MAG: NAD-dependent protein deacylase [Pirellulaceae bacterium]
MSSDNIPAIERAVELFQKAESILFITGAGISAGSGLPTYRGIGGLYDERDTEDGISIEEALSGQMFKNRPEITWKYMAEIEAGARGKTFNPAHEAIAQIEKRWPRVWTLTQNIDGFHKLAGSRNVIEIHGTMRRLRCTGCARRRSISSYQILAELPPRCVVCKNVERPEVVLFGEMLPLDEVKTLQNELDCGFDLVVSVGTSSLFPYIVDPVYRAHRNGVPTIEINPAESTEISQWIDVHIQQQATPAFEQIMANLDKSL